MSQDASGTEQRAERVLALFHQLGTLDAKIDFEHSFKAVHSRLFENRFLLGINRSALEESRDDRITSIAEKIGMPHNFLESFKHNLHRANHVYFGVEKDEHTLLFKMYLEFRDEIEREMGGSQVAGRSYTLFTGFKWDAFAPLRQAITQYSWHPSLPVPGILQSLRTILDPGRHRVLLEAVEEITRHAAEQIPCSDIQYLEVTEEGSPRRSFDINIYKSGLRFLDVSPYVSSVLRQYAIPPGSIETLHHKIQTERVGHLAGGVDRMNNDFLTVYYGVKFIHSDQLRSAAIGPGGSAN